MRRMTFSAPGCVCSAHPPLRENSLIKYWLKWSSSHCNMLCHSCTVHLQTTDFSFTLFNPKGTAVSPAIPTLFFKTSAKDIKNTPSILVVQISVIHQLKLWSVYFFVYTHEYNKTLWFLEKKKENKQDALFVFSISASCSSKYVTKMNCNSAKTQHTDMRVISIESWKCLLWNEVSLIENKHSVMK